jgi:DNA-binding transcriptional LysR family regulator
MTKAAAVLHISQPSISKQLRLLEEEFAVKFHVGSNRGIALTQEGHLFWSAVRPVLQQINEIEETFAKGKNKNQSGFLSIGATQSPSSSLLPEVLKSLRRNHSSVQTVSRTADSRIIEQMLLNSEIDLGLITYPSYNPKIILEPIRREEAVAVVSAKHPIARKRKLTKEELAKVPVLVRSGGKIEEQLQKMGFKLNIVMRGSFDAIKAGVESALGLGFFLRDAVELGLRQGYLKNIQIPGLKEIDVKCFLIYREDVPLSPCARDFLKLVHRMARA